MVSSEHTDVTSDIVVSLDDRSSDRVIRESRKLSSVDVLIAQEIRAA